MENSGQSRITVKGGKNNRAYRIRIVMSAEDSTVGFGIRSEMTGSHRSSPISEEYEMNLVLQI